MICLDFQGICMETLFRKKKLSQPILISILNKAKDTDYKILSTRLEDSNKCFATIAEYP